MSILDSLRDRAVRRVVRLGLPVVLGKAVGSVTSLVTLYLLAHHLDLHTFGVIAMIRTVVIVIDQYTNFNTWQAIIKYGTELIAGGRRDDVRLVIKLAFVIDVLAGVVGAAVAAGLAIVIPRAFDWTNHQALMFALFALTLMLRGAGAADGTFRICDAYRAQAISTSLGSIIMTGAIAVAVGLDAGFDGIVLALIVGESLGNMVISGTAMWVAGQHGYTRWWAEPLRGARTRLPGILRFLLSTNGQLTVRKTQAELDMFVINFMLGTIAAGLFRVVKQLGTIPGRIFMPFEQVLFTELSRSAAEGDYHGFRSLLRKSAMLLGAGSLAVWLVAAIVAEPLIDAVAGPEFVPAAAAFRWYLLGMVLVVASAPVQRAMIALGRPGTLLLFELATLVVLFVAMLIGAYYWGLVGASVAVVLHKVLQLSWSTWLVSRVIKSRQQA